MSPQIRTDLRPGDLGKLIALHGMTYRPEDGFGLEFEAYVAQTVAEFILGNRNQGRIWLAEQGDTLAGCVALAERPRRRGQLRWLVVHPDYRGSGLGRRLVQSVIEHAKERELDAIYLETTDGLDASMRLYASLGFRVMRESVEVLWSSARPLIVMEKDLSD